jgi:hypothetical protein
MYKKMVAALNTYFIVTFNKVDVIEPNTKHEWVHNQIILQDTKYKKLQCTWLS